MALENLKKGDGVGNWPKIEKIIDEVMKDEDITLVIYRKIYRKPPLI